MITDFSIAKQAGQQGQCELSEGRISKRLLPLQGLNSAATPYAIIIETGVHYLGKQLRRRSKAQA